MILLLNHENIDISVDALNFFADLVDQDLEQDYSDQLFDFYQIIVQIIYKKYYNLNFYYYLNIKHIFNIQQKVKNHLIEHIVQNIMRLDESKSDQFSAIHKSLEVIEKYFSLSKSLCEIMPSLIILVQEKTDLVLWILNRINPRNIVEGQVFDDNKLYCSEILSILFQDLRKQKVDVIDYLLEVLNFYRKIDPQSEDEREFVENIYDCLYIVMLDRSNLVSFYKNQGIQLMIRILKQNNFSSLLTLKILQISVQDNQEACELFIDNLGLKFIFPVFMKKGLKKEQNALLDEYILTCIKELLKNTNGVFLDRVINKFRENKYEKLDKIIEIHQKSTLSLQIFENEQQNNIQKIQEMAAEKEMKVEEIIYLEKLENGLSILQLTSFIMVFLLSSEQKIDDVREKIKQKLKSHEFKIETLQGYINYQIKNINRNDLTENYIRFLNDIIKGAIEYWNIE